MTDIERVPSSPEPAAAASRPDTARETVLRVEQAWFEFRVAAARFPGERMDEHLGEDGWTRKQMLAHIAAWHDLTTERLAKLFNTGMPAELTEEVDAVNARVARQAAGKTAGEIIKDMEATFNRLRRHLQRLNDANLNAHDGWASRVIAVNTYEHYAEHMPEIYVPEPVESTGRRR